MPQLSYLLNEKTDTGAGAAAEIPSYEGKRSPQTYQAKVAGTGAVVAVIDVEVSNDRNVWEVLGTISLSGTTSDSDGFASAAGWPFVRGNVKSISGTGAAATLTMGA